MKSDKTKQQFGYIYIITCLVNNIIYVGQRRHHDPYGDITYLGSGTIIGLAIKKYGKENFVKKILIVIKFDQKLLDKFEEKFIEKYNSCDEKIGYNILSKNAFGMSPENRLKCLKKAIENRKPLTKEKRKELSENRKAYCASPEGLKQREIMKDLMNKKWEDKDYVEKRNKGYEEYEKSDKYQKLINEHSVRMNEKWRDGEFVKKQSKSRKEAWKSKKRKKNHLERFRANEKKFRKAMIKTNIGSKFINDGIIEKKLKKNEFLPEGFKFGRLIVGRKWSYDSTTLENKLLKIGEKLPDGFVYGRIL